MLGHGRELLGQSLYDTVELGLGELGVGLVLDRVQHRLDPAHELFGVADIAHRSPSAAVADARVCRSAWGRPGGAFADIPGPVDRSTRETHRGHGELVLCPERALTSLGAEWHEGGRA